MRRVRLPRASGLITQADWPINLRRVVKSILIFNFRPFRICLDSEDRMDAMLVCHCRGVSDRQIKRAVKNGACSLRDVARATGAGMRCGGCRENVAQVVQDALQSEFHPSSVVLSVVSSVGSMIRLELPVSVEG